ncbi:hypothetical protein GN244_ATG12823 [Phytophthora infestans]|uniref:Uncharacterized protein n=1 Tax=Phytophthora infestans TaxID=4787 RepID=A0A833SIM2_PHYIN|nr:hypothetical protein GN244_ATG12823 [Phytophthora infestans]KAF4134784.1 hypothetical protein GN958_ATG16040 [Phytophthora infestans]
MTSLYLNRLEDMAEATLSDIIEPDAAAKHRPVKKPAASKPARKRKHKPGFDRAFASKEGRGTRTESANSYPGGVAGTDKKTSYQKRRSRVADSRSRAES